MEEIKNSTTLKQAVINKTRTGIGVQPAAKALDAIILFTISLVFFLCPIFFTGFAAQSIDFEKMLLFYFLVLLGIVAWVAKGAIRGELEFKRTPLDWPILVLIAVFAISAILSVNLKDSLIGSFGNPTKGLAAIITFSLFYYLVVNNINIKRVKLVFWSIVVSSSLVIIYSLLQLLNIFVLPMDFTHLANFNPIGSLTGLTMFIVMVLPILVVAISQVKEIQPNQKNIILLLIKIIIGLVVLAGVVILAFLNGFTFWPAAIAGLVIIFMFFFIKNNLYYQ